MGDADLFFDLLIVKKCSYAAYDNVVSYVDDSGISKQKEYEIRQERNKMLSKYAEILNNDQINRFLNTNHISKILIAVKDYPQITEKTLTSIKNQSYSNIEICDYEKVKNVKNNLMIIIEHDTILPQDYVKDYYNNYIFTHSFNRK